MLSASFSCKPATEQLPVSSGDVSGGRDVGGRAGVLTHTSTVPPTHTPHPRHTHKHALARTHARTSHATAHARTTTQGPPGPAQLSEISDP